jgi:hypothetical protein
MVTETACFADAACMVLCLTHYLNYAIVYPVFGNKMPMGLTIIQES